MSSTSDSQPINTPSTSTSPSTDPTSTTPNPLTTDSEWNSPGNAYSPNSTSTPPTPPMKLPNLSFLYRLECNIAREEINVGAPHSAGIIRSIANIVDGEVNGPRVKGRVLPLGGADWATVVEGTHVSPVISIACLVSLLLAIRILFYVAWHGLVDVDVDVVRCFDTVGDSVLTCLSLRA